MYSKYEKQIRGADFHLPLIIKNELREKLKRIAWIDKKIFIKNRGLPIWFAFYNAILSLFEPEEHFLIVFAN